MPQTSSYTTNYNVGSSSITGNRSIMADRVESYEFTLAAGQAGVMDSTTGVDGLTTGHGLVTADIIDLHYDDPSTGEHKVRRGLVIDTDAANAITFDETPAGEGDSLPANDVNVVVAVQVTLTTMSVVGNNIKLIVVGATSKSVIDIRQNASTSKQVAVLPADDAWAYVKFGNNTNPFAGITITVIHCSNATTSEGRMTLAVNYDLP